MAVIYHGTPMTPRAALLDVCRGRAMCVSFFRPDDVEAVEAISPAIMFRQRCVLDVESGATSGARVGRKMGLVRLFRMVGASPVPSRALGCNPRYAGGTLPAQRCTYQSMAVWPKRVAPLAYGRPNRAPFKAVRQIRPCVAWVDRAGQALRQAGVPQAHGRGRSRLRQSLASDPHDAWDQGGMGLPFHQRRRNDFSSEWMEI